MVVTGSWLVVDVGVGDAVVLSGVLVDVANVVEVMLSELVVAGAGVEVVSGVEVVVVSAGSAVVEGACEMEVGVSATDVEAGSAVELDSVLVGVLAADVAAPGVVAAAATELVLSVAVLLTLVDIVISCLDKLLVGGAMLAEVIEECVTRKRAWQVG